MKEALKLALKFVEDSECGTADLEAHIKEALAQPERDYERGFIDGMQKQMQSSVDKAVNRMAQPAQQEPVALVISGVLVKSKFPENYTGHLYTTPPQRTWVGLTDREKSNLWLESRAAIPRFHTYASLVEAKLREKNQ